MFEKLRPETRKQKIIFSIIASLVILFILYQVFAYRSTPKKIEYGVSFNVPYAMELGLDWKEAYIATMDDMGFKRLRLAAHWPLFEPNQNEYDFSYLDFQLEEARKRNVDVILTIGRRVPRWPECHVPEWAKDLSETEWQDELLFLMSELVLRYKHFSNISYWQIENEPFLKAFAYEHCSDLDVDFLDRQIELVRTLDPDRPILITDSGNLGNWSDAYARGDAFGTSVYVYFWNPNFGKFRTFLPASFYRAKANWNRLLRGKKETFLIELSLEPWLIKPLIESELEEQFEMMNVKRINNIFKYAKKTRLEKQYLWGVEWWYWLKETHKQPEIWNLIKDKINN